MSTKARAQTREDFFSSSVLHDIRLTISQRDWQALKSNFDQDTYYAADLRWNSITLRNVGIRSRGHLTRNGLKPGLRVDINRYLSEQQLFGLTAFVLDNAYNDPSLLRERLAMTLFNRLGIAAPREAHARLFINDEYAGVYLFIEAIDRAFIADVFDRDEANVERGGHLFEYRWVRPYAFEYLGPELEAYAELFTPQTRHTDSMIGLFGRLVEMIRTINEAPDDRFTAAVGEYLDLPQFMRYLAVENFLAEGDGLVGEWGLHNFYLYRHRHDGRAQLIPWDKDTTFNTLDHPVDFRLLDNVLTRRAIAMPELRQIYFETLLQCASVAQKGNLESPDARGWLEREIDRAAGQIRGAVADDLLHPFTLDEFDAQIEWLRHFARQRPAAIACAAARMFDTAGLPQGCPLVELAPDGR